MHDTIVTNHPACCKDRYSSRASHAASLNLATDPGQKTNLVAQHPGKVKESLELLEKVRAQDNDAKVLAP